MKYNERKLQMLNLFLFRAEPATSHEVASQLDMTRRGAAMGLMRYFRQGLLRRTRRKKGQAHDYSLSLKGRLRLEWEKSKKSSI